MITDEEIIAFFKPIEEEVAIKSNTTSNVSIKYVVNALELFTIFYNKLI